MKNFKLVFIVSIAILCLNSCEDDKPGIPGDITVSAILDKNGKDVLLNWVIQKDSEEPASFEISMGDSILNQITDHEYVVNGLEYNKEYTFSILAMNKDGDKSNPDSITISTAPYGNGVLITNEGSFGSSNGSVSFYNTENDEVVNNIFSAVNSRPLGDVVQSIHTHDWKAYVVVNNSSKVEVVNQTTFEEIGVITDLGQPRHMVSSGTAGYVSCWGDNSVKIINLEDNSVTGSIPTGSGPEKMLVQENKIYVTNSGGWGTDSIISVIDMNDNSVSTTIEVRYSPKDIISDGEGNIWTLCSGMVIYDPETYEIVKETPCMLYKIDSDADQVVEEYELFMTQHPTNLEIDSQGILYVGGGFGFQGIYQFDELTEDFTMLIDDFAYGFNIDPETDVIYATITPDFLGAGILKRYSISGTSMGEYTVGIGPNSASFKKATE